MAFEIFNNCCDFVIDSIHLCCWWFRVLELQLMYDTYHLETVDALKVIRFVTAACQLLGISNFCPHLSVA